MINKGFVYSKQKSLFGSREVIGFFGKKLKVVEVDRNIANDIIRNNHYSKKFYNASYIHLGCYVNNNLVGILQFGYAMNPASQGSVVKDIKIDEYLELNRMWFVENQFRNIKSMAISYSIKYIKRKYPKIKWIQSFADERCNKFGIVYQASNFKYYGMHTSIFWELDGVFYHNSLMTRNPKLSKSAKYIQDNKDRAKPKKLRQFRYIYFIDKRCENLCLLEQKQPPKHYNEISI